MKYRTFYYESEGEPASEPKDYQILKTALLTWKYNVSKLKVREGGKSILVDLEAEKHGTHDSELVWTEAPNGGCASGEGELGEILQSLEVVEMDPTPEDIVAMSIKFMS